MTKFTLFPKIVKVLNIHYDVRCYNGYCSKTVRGKRLIVGKYFVAEHSKTRGLNKGDSFIIKETHGWER